MADNESGPSGSTEPEGEPPPIWRGGSQRPEERGRGRRLGRRVLLVSVLALTVLVVGTAGGLYYLSTRLGDQVHRVPEVFTSLDPDARPAAGPGTTFLLMGIDTRADEPTTGSDAEASDFVPGRQRSDAIMLVHIDSGGQAGSVVSVPRDSWVPVAGHGTVKINSAYSYGGAALLVKTVESLTHTRIDHFAVIDFAGFRSITDAVGGIDVRIAAPTDAWGVHFHAGVNHLDGARALAYVRQRHGLPRGDLDREQRQQNVLRALLHRAASTGLLHDPAATYDLLDAVSKSVSVDDTLDNAALRTLAWHWRGLGEDGVRFVTAPVSGFGREGAADVVYLDIAATRALCSAAVSGDITHYLAGHKADTLPETPR